MTCKHRLATAAQYYTTGQDLTWPLFLYTSNAYFLSEYHYCLAQEGSDRWRTDGQKLPNDCSNPPPTLCEEGYLHCAHAQGVKHNQIVRLSLSLSSSSTPKQPNQDVGPWVRGWQLPKKRTRFQNFKINFRRDFGIYMKISKFQTGFRDCYEDFKMEFHDLSEISLRFQVWFVDTTKSIDVPVDQPYPP